MQRLRDWLPLFMPLLTGGLERALQLAEAMASRGFVDEGGTTHTGRAQVISVVGLLAILSGGLLAAWQQAFWGALLIIAGSAAIGGTLWLSGRSIPHTTYRRAPWGHREWLVTGGALVAVATFLFWGAATRTYNPYPALMWPAFDTLTGVALLGFLLPALVIGGRDDPL